LLLDIYQPDQACTAPRPTVMFVHGGGFNSGSRRGDNVDAIASDLTRLGINLISIDYRVQGDDPTISPEFATFESEFQALNTTEPATRVKAFVAAVEDALRALNWAQSSGAQYCIDPARLGVWGSSAGAYTVLHVAYTLDEYGISRPDLAVVVDYWGGLFRDEDLEAGEVPLFVLHGTNDPTVPYAEAIQIAERADSVGVPLSFYTVTGGGHGYEASGFFSVTVDGQSLGSKTAAFVAAHLRDGGQPVYERRTVAR
jgi:acetyl esterase/lipase